MADLPADNEGLGWIVSQDPTQLLLIPGLQPASITAAAAGDQQALAYLRVTAQHHAAHPGACILSPLDRICLELTECGERDVDEVWAELQENSPELMGIFTGRERFTRVLLDNATEQGELAAMKWVRAICPRTPDSESTNLVDRAAVRGHLEILKYLCLGPRASLQRGRISNEAAEHLECIKWLLSKRVPPYFYFMENILVRIAEHHDLSCLQWLQENGVMTEKFADADLLVVAVEKGDQPMLEWLRSLDPRVPWHFSVCQEAAERGKISMLAWLRDQEPPCPWGESVTTSAAAFGQLEALQWLRAQENPCPWSTTTCTLAAHCGRLDILSWLRGQIPPCPWTAACAAAAASNPQHLAVLQWLHAHGCAFDDSATQTAARGGSLPMLRWLHSICCPLHPDCLDAAVRQGDLAMLEWLCEQGCSLTGRLYIAAAEAKQGHMLKYLYNKRVPVTDRSCDRLPPTLVLSHLMFLADIGIKLPKLEKRRVAKAREAYCTFHGLVRWCRLAVSDRSKGALHAFDSLAADSSGQVLLSRLCLIPEELLIKIAVAAEIQHDICSP